MRQPTIAQLREQMEAAHSVVTDARFDIGEAAREIEQALKAKAEAETSLREATDRKDRNLAEIHRLSALIAERLAAQ